jgi:hypothetical protein
LGIVELATPELTLKLNPAGGPGVGRKEPKTTGEEPSAEGSLAESLKGLSPKDATEEELLYWSTN